MLNIGEETKINELDESLNLRIWNKRVKEFFYVEYSALHHKILLVNRKGTIFYPLENLIFTSHWEKPQRPTGLDDKNGTITYEGDIVKLSSSVCKAEIFYWNGSFSLKWLGMDIEKENPRPITDISNDRKFYLYQDLTIIGNIYEVPELLEA